MMHILKKHPHNLSQGFTFIEFVVILSIFAIMAGIGLFNFKGFTRNTRLQNLVQDIALGIKGAQTLGVSAVGDNDLVPTTEQIVGLYFPFSDSTDSFQQTFITFRDTASGGLNGRGVYDDGADGDIVIHSSSLRGGYIRGIDICHTSNNCDPIKNDLVISFRRPDPEPIITSTDGNCTGSAVYEFAHSKCVGTLVIHVVADNDDTITQDILVEPSGQIRIE